MKLIDIINEQSLGYTPEGIDSLIVEASTFYERGLKFYESNYNEILVLTIQDCINDFNTLNQRLKKLQEGKKLLEQKYDKYFNIVDTFELGNYPENVKRLESIATNLDNLQMNLGDVIDGLDSLLDSAKYLSKHKQ